MPREGTAPTPMWQNRDPKPPLQSEGQNSLKGSSPALIVYAFPQQNKGAQY